MPDSFNIPENVRKAAASAYFDREQQLAAMPDGGSAKDLDEESPMTAAIRACLKEWAIDTEYKWRMLLRNGILEYRNTERRLALPWEPVEGDDRGS